jgi:hypothetical protein
MLSIAVPYAAWDSHCGGSHVDVRCGCCPQVIGGAASAGRVLLASGLIGLAEEMAAVLPQLDDAARPAAGSSGQWLPPPCDIACFRAG